MNLSDIGLALSSVTQDCFRYNALKKSDKYIVWSEDGQSGSGHADNKTTTQVITGTVDYFTKTENDANVDEIQAVLNSLNLAWRLSSVQYEDDTRYIHFEWVWEKAVRIGG